ncbi:MAG: hypothetical protein HIU93_03960 [Acidobacteria bacterium]|nr:hypothetical protein [Acidobacteriota bacterium]MBW4044708.1 hypothetical protein [Acidobacteriota bacterium]MBW4045576.1 hypothetical protein [Acidobacteriota bacterium]
MDTQNSQKKSPRSSAKNERQQRTADTRPRSQPSSIPPEDEDRYFDRTPDLVERIRRAKEAAQREMESFGDVSEYTITYIQGQKKKAPQEVSQPSLDFDLSQDGEAE